MQENPSHLTHTVCFAKKLSDGAYGSEDATFFIQFDTPIGTPNDVILQKGADAFFAAKLQVFCELGLDISTLMPAGDQQAMQAAPVPTAPAQLQSVPAQTDFAAEVAADQAQAVREAFPGAQVVANPAVGASPPFDSETRDRAEKDANTAWGWARFEVAPQEFFDNRPKKASGEYKSTSPDLKHKDTKTPIWPVAS